MQKKCLKKKKCLKNLNYAFNTASGYYFLTKPFFKTIKIKGKLGQIFDII
jgi:hypothetical protein